MMLTDPIADMLTRIRNAVMIRAEKVDIPASRMKLEIAKIMKEEGFIRAYKILKDKKQGVLRITLKYAADNEAIISGIKRVSKPGRRVYADKDSIPTVMGGVGISVLSTSRGVLGDKTCRREKVGGEVLCYIW
ncbi:MAG: 30S ribosomal protein S8 [Nitrospiraceae bacterium]|nr:30S ribosomal protein S8 [Nitrospiraceae bacterium]